MSEFEYVVAGETGDSVTIEDLLVWTGLVNSRSEARRVTEQGGAYLNNEKAEAGRLLRRGDLLHDRWVLVRRGKKNYSVVEVVDTPEQMETVGAPVVLASRGALT